ncbi:nucleoside-diphosphate kinase [Streptomyces sp. W16]|uniref:nucleoside-diphosphate kinase n=1 Tax=Streptomyces sp. W16 TaxID=3076631 RepID=UPI00295C21F9|nr:nucleoside-diphosphate kinase [Streptomyces sp. W16]MDV9173449.1 nucleoside-diphosphate kinase [Streptomyces sp. W16]
MAPLRRDVGRRFPVSGGRPMSGAVVEGIDFDCWAVILCKPDAVARGLVKQILERISGAGVALSGRLDLIAEAWQPHVVYRDLLADTGRRHLPDLPVWIDAAFAGREVTVALAHCEPGLHARLRQLIGHTDPARAATGTIRGDLGDDSLAAAGEERRLVRNLVHTSDDPAGARREYGTWYGPGRRLQIADFDRCSVILCKPDAVERGLTDTILARIEAAGCTIASRRNVVVQPWQAHVHYWDLLVDADHFPDRDIPACLDDAYAGKAVTVALAYGEPGIHLQLRQLIGHFDPLRAAPGTIRGDLGHDSLERALDEKRLVHNLVHTSDDAGSARRDFGTWFGADHRALLTTPTSLPAQPTSTDR